MPHDDTPQIAPIRLPIEDVLDLHPFNPKEIPLLIEDYLAACQEAGIYSVRLIHGKGSGILKKRVHALLKKMPTVVGFTDAPPEAGGWGATVVDLHR